LSVSKEEPKAGGPQVHVSPEKIPKHANAQESQEEIENVEAKQDIKPSGNSVGSEPETSEPNVNSNSSPSGESENKAQSLPVVVSPANNELGTGLIDSASKNTSEEESDLRDTSEVKNLHRNTIQSDPNSVQVVDNETAASHSNGHLNPVSNSSCPGDSTEKPIGTAYTCPRTADSAHCTEECPDEKATLDGSAHSEKVDNGGITASSLLSEGNNGHRAEHSPTPKEDVPVMGSQVQVPNITTSCRGGDTFVENDNGSPCSAENGTELVTDNGNKSDFFGKIFEVISNKDHIIQASAPMGIVMLLGLLFKVN
ncbi:VIR protein, partial [Plasmodium vivax]